MPAPCITIDMFLPTLPYRSVGMTLRSMSMIFILLTTGIASGQYLVETTGTFIPQYNNPTDVTVDPNALSAPLDIGFNFNFFGTSYNTFYISSKGFITFDANAGNGNVPQTLPDPNNPNNLIAAVWGDINPDESYFVYETTGTAPNRSLYFTFSLYEYGEPGNCENGYTVGAEIVLHETSNIIEIHIDNWDGDGCGVYTTQGIENATGSIAFYHPLRNNSLWNTFNSLTTFIPTAYTDLAVINIDHVLCSGLQDINLLVENKGGATIDTFYADWIWDGTPQASVPYYINLAPHTITEITLGQKLIEANDTYDLVAWTYDPENDPDQNMANDTMQGTITTGLSGTLTIGGTTPDFTTIAAAVSNLMAQGVCDSVIFNIRPGTYVEEIDFTYFYATTGGYAVFQSETGNDNDVIISKAYTVTGTNRLVELTNSGHLHFRNLQFRVSGGACANVFYMTSFCDDIQFDHCLFYGTTCTSTSNSAATIYMFNGEKDNIRITNCQIRRGSYGIYASPGYPSLLSEFELRNTIIDSCNRYGAFLSRTEDVRVVDNTIFLPASTATGLETNVSFGNARIEKNKITAPLGIIGLNVYGHNYNIPFDGDTMWVINNMVQMGGPISGSLGLYASQCNGLYAWHNTIHTTSTHINSRGVYMVSNPKAELRNSIVTNTGIGAAASLLGVTTDYNDYFNITPPLFNYSTPYADLAAWQAASGQDAHSLQVNPEYVSATDLHIEQPALNGAGAMLTPLVTIDIDDEERNTSTPDIGADEIGFLSNDLTVHTLLFSNRMALGENVVSVVVYNIGTNAVDDYELHWKLNAVDQTTVIVNQSIPAGGVDTILLGTIIIPQGLFTISVHSDLPNGMADSDMTNDTITIGPVYAPVNGIYTVGGFNPDFTTLTAAMTALQNGGVVDSVSFAIRYGIYTEPINLVAGSSFSCSKPIRIYGESLNADDVLIHNNNLVQPTVRLNGISGVKFSYLSFQLTASAFNNVVIVENGASCNSFTNCKFTGRITNLSTAAYYTVLCSSNQGVNNDFIGCEFLYGSFGLNSNGPNSASDAQMDIIGNHFKNNYRGGLYIIYSDRVHILNNTDTVTTAQHASRDGMFANNCNNIIFSGNSTYNPFGGGNGIGMSECDGISGDTSFFYNNYAYVNGGNALSVGYSNVTVVANNTGRNLNGYGGGFSWSANFKIQNNIFIGKTSGAAIELLNMQGTDIKSLNNCLYAINTDIGEFQNIRKHSMADWQAAGFDLNSISVDPLFTGTTHHAHHAALDDQAVPYYFITTDFDGETRNTLTPDIGADEFEPAPNDAGLLAITNPSMPFPTGVNPVYVKFTNNGSDTLHSVQLNWKVNGVLQPAFPWNGALSQAEVYDSLEIGTFDFAPYTAYTIEAWVSEPNGMQDGFSMNDTVSIVSQIPGMAGVYTIGGESPDFETITDAVNAITAGGASAAVTFNIRTGVYAQPIALNDFPGSDCDRPVTFQSESGVASDVTITNLGINAYTVVLTGADGVQFKNLSLKSVNTSFRHVVLLSGGAHCNQFIDNVMTGFVSTATANTSAVIRSTVGLDTANVFIGNKIYEGSWAFHLTGNSGGFTNTRIENNYIDTYYRGIYINAMQGVKITSNTFRIDHTTSRGIEIYDSPMLQEISGNDIQLPLGQYGIYFSNVDNTTTSHGRIYNNMISIGGTGIANGIYMTGCAYQDVIHNSSLVYSTNATLANTNPVEILTSVSVRLYNNAFKNSGAGYSIYCNSNTTFVADRNAYFTAGTTFGYWNGGTAETTFALWKTASTQDANSLNVNPAFLSNTNLHTYLALLNGTGEPNLGVTVDFDGETRGTPPDIGGDEFDPLLLDDAGISLFAAPLVPFANGNKNVNVVLQNYGGNTLTTVTIRWTVNGIEQTPFLWTGSLLSAQSATVTIGTFLFLPLTSYQVDSWTEMPNGNTDPQPSNDLKSSNPFYASLSGIYTVGGFTPDFNLVSDLETILNNSGIVGNVTFNFRPGTYTEAILINNFPRTSYSQSVTFQSESGDSTAVTLTQNTNNISLIDFDNAHRITFKKLTLLNTKGNVVYIRTGSSIISIENCRLEGLATLSSARSLIYSPNTTEDSTTILNNVFNNGYYGIHLYGGTNEKRHIILGNVFIGNYYQCMYLRLFDGITVTGNTLNANYTTNVDLYMYSGTGACTITKNRIISDNSNVAVSMSTLTNVSSTVSQFANNFIYKSGTVSNDVVQIISTSKINIDFNSIHDALNHPSSAALYTENITTANVRDNILYAVSGAAYHNSGTLPTIHNYNDLFSLGPVVAQQSSTTYATLAAYASGTSTNANSKSLDPLFLVSGMPQVSQYLLNGTGLTISGITTDIDGTTRTSPPDIGAKEFTPLAHDIRLSHVSQPLDGCGLGDETVTAVLVNHGSMNETGFDVHYLFNGQTVDQNIGVLVVPAGDSLYFNFTQTIDVSAYDDYAITIWHTLAADLNPANDTTVHTFTNNAPFTTPAGNLIPADGTIGLENQVSLSWAPVDGAVKYDLYLWLSTASKPVTPTYANLTMINKLVTSLVYGSTYRWQVYAVNICNQQLPSDTSSFSTRFLPDLIVESMIIPATAFSEQTIGVEWVVKNQGQGITVPGTWYDNIYLSPDPTYNSFDPLLKSVSNLNSLNAGQSYNHSAQVTLPQGTNGLYYIIIKTDHYAGVKETLDNNNTKASATQMNVTLSPPPDLLVTQITNPALTFSGQTINMTYTVANLGSGATTESVWKDEIYLLPAAGNSNGISALLATKTHIGALQVDSQYVVNLAVLIPANISDNYQLRVTTDYKDDVFEFASENNNLLLGSVFEVVLTPPADLVPDSLVVPDTISLYHTQAVHFQVKNNGGSAPTIGWTDRYYISPSPVYNTNFLTPLGYAYHNAGLMPGNYEEKTVNFTLNGNYSGINFIYLFTDYNNKINEYAYEYNNILRSDPFTVVQPDIVPDSMIHVANAMSGTTISLRTEFLNYGPGQFYGTFTNRYYLSTDMVLNTLEDVLLTTGTMSNVTLGTHDTLSQTRSLVIPANVSGAYFILCQVDGGGNVYEANENNNVKASPIMIFESPHPDLITSMLTTPTTATCGQFFNINYTLTNQGDKLMNQSARDSMFLSFNPVWNRANAVPLATRTTSFLDTSQSVSYTVPIQIAIDQNPNIYYLYIISDATSIVYEGSGESNNILRSAAITVNAYPDIDLALTNISGAPDTLTSGQHLPISYTVKNLSTTGTFYTTWTERYYFSIDSFFNAGTDMLLGSYNYPSGSIVGLNEKQVSATLNIPDGISGDYYLFIETDAENINHDPSRSNNSNTVRVTGAAHRLHVKLGLYPDLQFTVFNCPVEVVSGQYFNITKIITNAGNGSAGARVDKIFVSTNNIIDAGDLTLSSSSKPLLSAGNQQTDVLSVFVPANYSGNYYIICSIDHGDLVYEHNGENNNILLASIIATPPPPADLIVRNILVPDSILAGETGMITWETKNQGANPATGLYREIVYLSPDTTWNLTDEVIGIWDGNIALSPGSATTKSVSFPYNNVTNADYHTIIRTDAKNNIAESQEDNNDGFSYDLTNVDIKEIFLNQTEYTSLTPGFNRYYKLYIGAEAAEHNVYVTLKGDSLAGINQLFVKYGAVPTEADHDYSYSQPFSADQRILIRHAQAGYYYILINGFRPGNNAPQPIELLAKILRMEIIDMSPRKGGNKGYTTIEAIGSELDSIVVVKLVLNDSTQAYHEIIADTFFMADEGTRIVARFNLENEILGHYDFLCQRESIWMTSYTNGFEVIEGSGAEVQVEWEINPKSYNPRFNNSLIQIKVDVENTGDADAEDRFIRVGTPTFNNPVYYSLVDYYNGVQYTQLVLATEDLDGFAGILRPGGRRTFYVFGHISGIPGFSIQYDK